MIASREDIIQCQFQNWYLFLVGKTFKSRVITLPTEFITYLGEDGVILPKSSRSYFNNDALSDEDDGKIREISDAEDEPISCLHDFSILDASINEAIQDLQGEVMVKLNWSCPLDAIWANAGSLKCRSPSDIYMLLKSSDRVTFDLEKMFLLCPAVESTETLSLPDIMSTPTNNIGTVYTLPTAEYTLVLRKWANLNPAMEFRVFVKDRAIIGICQRDCCTYYDFLEAKIDDIQDHIYDFFYGTPHLPKKTLTSVGVKDLFPLASYAMDVYVDLKNRVWLVDFNPFGEPTCALLYEWEELCSMGATADPSTQGPTEMDAEAGAGGGTGPVIESEPQLCEFRIIESPGEVLQSSKGSSRGPIDVHAASEFRSFMDLCKAQHQEGDSGSDSD